ncbi:sensor histidine kinase [Oerskovia turbata]|nr:histidine kinase [Oerskovia turbata]
MVTAAPSPGPIASPPPPTPDGSPDRSRTTGAAAIEREAWRTWVFPGVLALLVGLFTLVTPIQLPPDGGLWTTMIAEPTLVLPVIALGSFSAVAAVLVTRRSTLLACVLAGWPFLLLPLIGTFVWAWWLALLAVAVVAAYDRWHRALLPFALATGVVAIYCTSGVPAMLPIGPVTSGSESDVTFVLYVVMSFAVVATSAAVGAGQRARLRTAAAALAADQAFAVETIAVERARIAHDLHDVVAHHISLVAVRAESAPYVHPSMDAGAKVVLADIADDARHALGELRQVLAVLQRTEGADRAPQPGAGDVLALVDAARSAGQHVTVVEDVPDLPSAQGLVLYRAVQESLTNARRHAPGQPVTITLGTGATPSGTVVTARVSNPLVPRTSPAAPGRGLLGMRERVESIGGSLTAGEEDGSFVVALTLPLTGPEPAPATAPERAETHLLYSAGDPLDVHLLDVPDGTDA